MLVFFFNNVIYETVLISCLKLNNAKKEEVVSCEVIFSCLDSV